VLIGLVVVGTVGVVGLVLIRSSPDAMAYSRLQWCWHAGPYEIGEMSRISEERGLPTPYDEAKEKARRDVFRQRYSSSNFEGEDWEAAWSDPEFVEEVRQRAEEYGANLFSFVFGSEHGEEVCVETYNEAAFRLIRSHSSAADAAIVWCADDHQSVVEAAAILGFEVSHRDWVDSPEDFVMFGPGATQYGRACEAAYANR
jgi:hypothetical protein